MKDILIKTHNCSREEFKEIIDYLVNNNWDYKEVEKNDN